MLSKFPYYLSTLVHCFLQSRSLQHATRTIVTILLRVEALIDRRSLLALCTRNWKWQSAQSSFASTSPAASWLCTLLWPFPLEHTLTCFHFMTTRALVLRVPSQAGRHSSLAAGCHSSLLASAASCQWSFASFSSYFSWLWSWPCPRMCYGYY